MRIIGEPLLEQYVRQHARVAVSLAQWQVVVRDTHWQSFVELRKTYRTADTVKAASGRAITIFNIAGGGFRLLTAIDYATRSIEILDLLTHAEYDKENWKTEL
jgi:mRNA interferase HigB